MAGETDAGDAFKAFKEATKLELAQHKEALRLQKEAFNMQLKISEESAKEALRLARLEIAMVIMQILSPKLAVRPASCSPEEQKINNIAELIFNRGGEVTIKEIRKAISDLGKEEPGKI